MLKKLLRIRLGLIFFLIAGVTSWAIICFLPFSKSKELLFSSEISSEVQNLIQEDRKNNVIHISSKLEFDLKSYCRYLLGYELPKLHNPEVYRISDQTFEIVGINGKTLYRYAYFDYDDQKNTNQGWWLFRTHEYTEELTIVRRPGTNEREL